MKEKSSWKEVADLFKNRKAGIMGQQVLRKAAVLVPLVDKEGELHVLFEERAHHLRNQPGEICFPGGRLEESDPNPLATAVRETCEELRIAPEWVEPMGELDVLVSYFQIIYPYVGRITDLSRVSPDPDEVANVFTVPLAHLLQSEPQMHPVGFEVVPPEEFPFDLIQNGRAYKWRKGTIPQYFYLYEDRVIWGLTAKILRHFLELVKSGGGWK